MVVKKRNSETRRRLGDLVLEGLDDADLGDVAGGAGLDDAGLLGEGVDALACLAGLAALGDELADAVEGEGLALLHLVVHELEESFVDGLADLTLDTGHVLEGLGDLRLAHLLTLGGGGLLATVVDAGGGLLGGLGDLGSLLLGGLLLLALLGGALLGLLGLALGGALLSLAAGAAGLAGGASLGSHDWNWGFCCAANAWKESHGGE